jgi:acyl-CoA synthetase (AMP-forming)/AMP-acid ligase II
MTIADLLVEQASVRPAEIALIDKKHRRKITFAELDRAVTQAASWWERQGIVRGKAVLVFVPMSADLYIAMLGLFRLGAVALFLDPSAGAEHIEQCCHRWPPAGFLGIPKAHLLRLKSSGLRRIPLKISVGGWVPGARRWLKGGDDASSGESRAMPGDAALVTFTSGSTGVPKAAVRTHAFLLAQLRALAPNIALQPGQIDFATLPVFVLANLAAGVTTVIPDLDLRRPGNVDAERASMEIEQEHVDRITASPAFFERLLAFNQRESRTKTLSEVRKIYTGGAPVFPRLLQELRGLAPNAEIEAVYGSTEAEPIAHVSLEAITEDDRLAMKRGKGLLAGHPVPEIEVAILSDTWGRPIGELTGSALTAASLRSGEIGEIVVSGEHVLPGYLGRIGEEETKFRVDGLVWHRTGDAGCMDERGRIWLQGRCAARIDDARGRLYPFGVECVAMTFRDVRRAALVAERGERWLIVAAEPSETLGPELLAATSWAKVDRVLIWDELPTDRRHNAKIDYPELRKRMAAHRFG